jgi:hypothetical protein
VSAERSPADLLAALLAATPEPPADPDPETVLDTTTAILAASAPLVAALRAALGDDGKLPGELLADASVLHDRTRRWLELAEAARRETGESLRAIARARSYEAHR